MLLLGVDIESARLFVGAFYSCFAQAVVLSQKPLADMAFESATPGGLNEQVSYYYCLLYYYSWLYLLCSH